MIGVLGSAEGFGALIGAIGLTALARPSAYFPVYVIGTATYIAMVGYIGALKIPVDEVAQCAVVLFDELTAHGIEHRTQLCIRMRRDRPLAIVAGVADLTLLGGGKRIVLEAAGVRLVDRDADCCRTRRQGSYRRDRSA